MSELKELTGNCVFAINGENRPAHLTIKLDKAEIIVRGEFADFVGPSGQSGGGEFSITEVQLFTHYGTLSGTLGSVEIAGIRPRGGSAFHSGSGISQLLSKGPEYNFDTLRIIPPSSLIELSLEQRFIRSPPATLWDRLRTVLFGPEVAVFPWNEVWFRCPLERHIHVGEIDVDGTRFALVSEAGVLSVRCSRQLSERDVQCLRACVSFYFGAETYYVARAGGSRCYLNLMQEEMPPSYGPVHYRSIQSYIGNFMRYALSLDADAFERFQNNLYFYIAGRSARLALNARLALLYIAIEATFEGSEDASLEAKIINLFNLDNARSPGYNTRTISNSMNQEIAGSLARIRNLIVHDGFMAEDLYSHCRNQNELRSRDVLRMCDDMAIPLWRFLLSNLDKYWLNKIRFSGTFLDFFNNNQEVQTIR